MRKFLRALSITFLCFVFAMLLYTQYMKFGIEAVIFVTLFVLAAFGAAL